MIENSLEFVLKQNMIFYIILFIVSLIDIKRKIIPDKYIVILGSIALIIRTIAAIQGDYMILLDGCFGFILGGLPLLVIAISADGGIGGGDIKLLAAIGMWVGKIKIIEISIGVLLVLCFIITFKILLKNKKSTALAPFITAVTMLIIMFR